MKNSPVGEVIFTCNICGCRNLQHANKFHREIPDCIQCGSTPRFRGTIFALSEFLFGKSLNLVDFPVDKQIKGVGMSEWAGYSNFLSEKFNFENTYYHTNPKLDITTDDWKQFKDCDFVLCMEVLEHIPAPYANVAFNIRAMLKDSGCLIFSTPYTDRLETKEHFPGLHKFSVTELDGNWVVLNKNEYGYQVFDRNVFFHGGPGTVLEMRVFAESDVIQMLRKARFETQVLDQAMPEIGYLWPLREERLGDGLGLNYVITARPVK